jgi:hypothetical protein
MRLTHSLLFFFGNSRVCADQEDGVVKVGHRKKVEAEINTNH